MRFILFLFFFVSTLSIAQIKKSIISTTKQDNDTLVVNSGKHDSLKIFVPTIQDYQYQTQDSEKKIFDTLLTHDKSYSFTQYTNQDDFGMIRFANIGAGYNPLAYSWQKNSHFSLLPTNKSYSLIEADQIKYYDVKTPTTAFVFHNGVSNGAALYSTYAQNIGKRFNFAINYFGLRSLGSYQNSLAVSNNTSFSFHYITKNSKYELFAHYIHQNIINQENGGITDDYDLLYQAGNNEINNRNTIPVNLNGSFSRFAYRRYYLSHQFSPFNVEKFPFKINHTLQHQGNKYYFEFVAPDLAQFSDVIPYKSLSSKKYSDNLSNTVSLLFDKPQFKIEAGVQHQNIQVGTNNILLSGNPILPNYTENRLGVIGNINFKFSDLMALKSHLDISRGNSFGNFILSENSLYYQPIKDYYLKANFNYKSASPNFNFLLNSSPLLSYNYDFSNFKNENNLNIGGEIGMKLWQTKLFVQYFRNDNMVYIDELHQPNQSANAVNLTQIGGETTYNYGNFFLNTRLQFQQNFSGKSVLPLPNFVGRANFFYQTRAFRDKAELQTGIKVYYFSKFNSRDFSPILQEYILPGNNSFAIGGQPIADIYFNFKVKKMFIFLEGQHFTTTFSSNTVYTAPHYPFYDFRLNIGIVWYLFS
ncbi:MAG: putative porin [Bacteroidetes bacterium]|nr:putative porin [Bacteroidota bacterium]